MIVDVYYTIDSITGMIIVKAWDRQDSMYPVLYNNKYLDYTIKEMKEHVQDKLDKIYKTKTKTIWHKQ